MQTTVKTERLLVSKQNRETRSFERIGELSHDADGYLFVYDPAVRNALPGLPLGDQHRADQLFPVFAERVIHPRRPDRAHSLEQLGLGVDSGPFEALAVSGGRRTGDTLELTPLPEAGPVDLPFLVHGIRHLTPEEQTRVGELQPGQLLQLKEEEQNTHNPRACLVTAEGTHLGYVPDPLVEYVHDVRQREHELRVRRVNPADAGLHMRLLVVLTGTYIGKSPR